MFALDARAHMLGLGQHLFHQPRPLDRIGESGIVLDVGRGHQLSARLEAREHERLQKGARGVNRRRVGGRPGADNDNPLVLNSGRRQFDPRIWALLRRPGRRPAKPRLYMGVKVPRQRRPSPAAFIDRATCSPEPLNSSVGAESSSKKLTWMVETSPNMTEKPARDAISAVQTFSTWPNSRSTGVARPKIDTATLTRERDSSTSSTTPLNEANGPSATRTFSPISNRIAAFGRSTPSATCPLIRSASRSGIGIGFLSAPRKPVTLGVFLIRW